MMGRAPRHIDFSKLKAFAARLHTAIIFEGQPDDELGATIAGLRTTLLQRIVSDADMLDTEAGPLDQSLKSFGRRWNKGRQPESEALKKRVAALARLTAKIDCESCAQARPLICRGQRGHDDKIIADGGACIKPLKDIMTVIRKLASATYAGTHQTFTPPSIHLATSSAHPDANSDLLGDFNLNAFHEVADHEETSSHVFLEIRERKFDWRALCGTPYLLTHEIVCHAFQGIVAGPTGQAPRLSAPKECAWSEGWMDRVAFMLTKFWLQQRRKELPAWLAIDPITLEAVTDAMHEKRYDKATCLREDVAHDRNMGRHAFRMLFDAFESRADVERHPATLFSLGFNLCNIGLELRNQAVYDMFRILRKLDRKLTDNLLGLCQDFSEFNDISVFLAEVNRLADR